MTIKSRLQKLEESGTKPDGIHFFTAANAIDEAAARKAIEALPRNDIAFLTIIEAKPPEPIEIYPL